MLKTSRLMSDSRRRAALWLGVLGLGGCVVLENQGLTALHVVRTVELQGDVFIGNDDGVSDADGLQRVLPCNGMQRGELCLGSVFVQDADLVETLRQGQAEEPPLLMGAASCDRKVTNFYPLSELREAKGSLVFRHMGVTSLEGLGHLTPDGQPDFVVGGELVFRQVCELSTLRDLMALKSFGGSLTIQNTDLVDVDGLPGAPHQAEINGHVTILGNSSLTSLEALSGVQRIKGNLEIRLNTKLSKLPPSPANLVVEGNVKICSNDRLPPEEVERWLSGVEVYGETNTGTSGIPAADDTNACRFNGCELDGTCQCGNGVAEGTEECDGDDVRGRDCVALGYDTGPLVCTQRCRYAKTCAYSCGSGVALGDEQCDGNDLRGQTCQSLGFDGGDLACGTCVFDTRLCTGAPPVCGDGVASGSLEQCDGNDMGGLTCQDLGYTGGSPCCHANCQINAGTCTGPGPVCGDGVRAGLEECDGSDLGGKTCASLGYTTGTLGCTRECRVNPSLCQ
ncbi:MAG: hypothetical protein AB2A00_35640 [Myxococcota bacterium]